MPCSALADAIVSSARATLEFAISVVKYGARGGGTDIAGAKHPVGDYTGAEVIYGDTDSMFVKLPGRTLEEAIAFGHEIARIITGMLPHPLELKFEKVYLGSVFVARKRYVGWSHEYVGDPGKFDAKGIETVRRDGCGLLRDTTRSLLEVLFSSSDLSQVKAAYQQTVARLLRGEVSVQALIFAKEVKFGHYRSVSSEPCGAHVVRRQKALDPLYQPPYKYRVPYVVCVPIGQSVNLSNSVHPPEVLLYRGDNLQPNVKYYVEKVLNAALRRLLGLAGCDIDAWCAGVGMPKTPLRSNIMYVAPRQCGVKNQTVITDHFLSGSCLICGSGFQVTKDFKSDGVCDACRHAVPPVLVHLTRQQQLREALSRESQRASLCRTCSTGGPSEATLFCRGEIVGRHACRSLDCANMYARARGVLEIEDLMA